MTDKIKATLPAESTSNGKWPDKKEQIKAMQIVAIKGGQWRTPVTARLFMGRASSSSMVYCSLWTGRDNASYNGYGTASGYGYHKESAALSAAIRSAGIKLDTDISGRGERAMREALSGIARALGYRKFYVVEL